LPHSVDRELRLEFRTSTSEKTQQAHNVQHTYGTYDWLATTDLMMAGYG